MDTATTVIYTLSLHDALPIWIPGRSFRAGTTFRVQSLRERLRRHASGVVAEDPEDHFGFGRDDLAVACGRRTIVRRDRKSTRLNSSHGYISYAVFCLKKKKTM